MSEPRRANTPAGARAPASRLRWWRHVIAAVLGVVVLAACGITADDAPRDINAPAHPDNAGDNGQTAITATNTSVIYLIGHDDTGRFVLKPIARDVTATIDNALAALFAGATPRELNADLRSAIPASTRLISATPNNDIVTVDVTDPLTGLSGATLVEAVGQIVLTATNVTGVSGVVITIDDVAHPWPTPDGQLTTDPLTRNDFTALLPNSGVRATDPTVAPTSPTTVAPTSPTTVAPTVTAAPSSTTPVTTAATPTAAPTAAPTPPALAPETVPVPTDASTPDASAPPARFKT